MASSGFEDLDHTADWAIRLHGRDLSDLLCQAAAAFLSLANPEPAHRASAERARVHLHAPDREALLVGWLEELNYLLEAKGQYPLRIGLVAAPDLHLLADLDLAHVASPGRPVKAVTYHDLHVADTPDGLEATVVFDV